MDEQLYKSLFCLDLKYVNFKKNTYKTNTIHCTQYVTITTTIA